MQLDSDAIRQALGSLMKKRLELILAVEKVNRAINALKELDAAADPTRSPPAMPDEPDPELAGLTIPEAAERVLHELRKPAHVYEIIERLQARGFRSDQERESLRLSLVGALARKARARDTFIGKGPGTYGLREWEPQQDLPIDGGEKAAMDTGRGPGPAQR